MRSGHDATLVRPDGIEPAAYVFADSSAEERDRLRLLASLLDPLHRVGLEAAGIAAGQSCMEVGSGSGTIAEWMADRVGPEGHVVAADINVAFLDGLSGRSNLEVRRLDVVDGPLPERAFDIITARALLHHLPAWDAVIARLATALKPGGSLVLIEPDASVSIANTDEVQRRYWSAWSQWGQSVGVDFCIGGKLPGVLSAAGLELVHASMDIPFYPGGSPWAELYRRTLHVARPRLGAWIEPDLARGFEATHENRQRWTFSLGWMVAVARRT